MRARPSLGLFNLALVAAYFAPVWASDALRALTSPYNGFEDAAHAAVAARIRDLFDFGLDGLIRTSGALAGLKLVVAAGFLAYLIEFARALAVQRMPDQETIDAVLFGSLPVVTLWLLSALAVGDAGVVRAQAAQFLLLVGAAVVITIEQQFERAAAAAGQEGAERAAVPPSSMRVSGAATFPPPTPLSDLRAGRPA
jgi:hypothetical protein